VEGPAISFTGWGTEGEIDNGVEDWLTMDQDIAVGIFNVGLGERNFDVRREGCGV
jgi:hypothetical protein